MCTVTFLPVENGVYLTSNRDEQVTRAQAMAPQSYLVNGLELTFPKDPDKGGSWIALKGDADAAVLLNGAFVKHIARPPYRESRGVILLEILSQEFPAAYFETYDLLEVEPFTLILYLAGKLYECHWTGTEKHQRELSTSIAHIWSSATLYEEDTVLQRARWFSDWQAHQRRFAVKDILDFHRFGGTGNPEQDLVINRQGKMMTKSITNIAIVKGKGKMTYLDLHQSGDPADGKLMLWFRKAAIRTFNWEYWPLQLVYAPVIWYWFWLSLKARSLFFFSAANPLILNSGFAMGKKSSIYELMPGKYYPKTLLCRSAEKIEDVEKDLELKGLRFPLMAKPDIGERGVKVKLLQSEPELRNYLEGNQVDFLLQEYIDYELEVGVFYYRIPGERKGQLSGIVGKEFLKVRGDGNATIAMLLGKEDRSFLQLDALNKLYGNDLNRVLADGVCEELVPYGSHNRGAKFIDLSFRINEELRTVIDQFCHKIPEFYYGRLDIKFKSWEELYAGKHFAVIEVNGAASEPTHMYDPVHSVFFAWKEIIRHWQLLYQISRLNSRKKGLMLMGNAEGFRMIRAHVAHLKMMA
jgi:hypothetical protein